VNPDPVRPTRIASRADSISADRGGRDPRSARAAPSAGLHDLHDLEGFRGARRSSDEGRSPDDGLRDELVRRHKGLAEAMAARYVGRGIDHDDLRQVAMIGLLKAIDRFDPDRGTAFSTFAVPTILGEIRRHFRDHGWTIRVPRRLQVLRREAQEAEATLEQHLGRVPTVDEVAEHLDEDLTDVRQALGLVASCFRPGSLEDRSRPDLPDPAPSTEAVACRVAEVEELLGALSPRDRRIFLLRYFGAMTQQQIADDVGISQMHVSRLLRKGLAEMRSAA